MRKFFPALIIFCLLLSSCAGLVQRGGEFLEGRAFAEMELSLYRSEKLPWARSNRIELRELRLENGEGAIDIFSEEWPGIVLRGGRPDGRGSFELHQARILSSHANGWNEFILDISGAASFVDPVFSYPVSSRGILHIDGSIERIQISSGSLRLRGNRFSGDAALGLLRNRRERILALTEWMNDWLTENDQGRALNHGRRDFINPREFERFWRPILFPELVFSTRRPAEYSSQGAQWQRADSINWNKSWTENILPEDLWELRNSGALLRDWEEALIWIFIEYSWDNIINSFNEAALNRIK